MTKPESYLHSTKRKSFKMSDDDNNEHEGLEEQWPNEENDDEDEDTDEEYDEDTDDDYEGFAFLQKM